MKQTFLSFILVLLPIMASADPVEIDGIWYNLIAKGKVAEVTQNPNYYTGDVVIPEKVTFGDIEYNVTKIGEQAFWCCYSLSSVIIPLNVSKRVRTNINI